MFDERLASVVHIVASLENPAAGPSYSVPALAAHLADARVDTTIFSTATSSVSQCGKFTDHRFRRELQSLSIMTKLAPSTELYQALRDSGQQIMHVHGLWTLPNLYPYLPGVRRDRKIVLSPRGMLGKKALEFSKLKKKISLLLGQSYALRSTDCLHATADNELLAIRDCGLTQPVAVVPNGVAMPGLSIRQDPNGTRPPVALYLGRVHPKKGLDKLVRAWAVASGNFPNWTLRIVGPSDGEYGSYLRGLTKTLGCQTIEFMDGVYGEKKFEMMSQAGFFVLPTLDENFGMVVAESLAVGVPVICTDGAPWSGLNARRCGWWIDQSIDSMRSALCEAMALEATDRLEMGVRGKKWMRDSYSWTKVASEMRQMYLWLLGHSGVPDFVEIP